MEFNESMELDTSQSLSNQRRRRLKAAQVRLLYAQSGIGSVGAFSGAVILGGALWKVVSHDRIIVWVLAYAALFLLRYYLIYFFHRQERDDDAAIRWGTPHTLAVSAGGLLWGVAGVWLFPQDSVPHQFLISIFIAGIAAAASVIYSPTKDYACNLLPALLPLSGRFIYEFDEFHVTIGGVILLFAGVLLLTGRRIHSVYADSLSLRYDKEELIEDLKQEIARRDRLEAELKTARDDLEMRVEARTAELKTLNRTLEQEIVERRRVEEELSKSEEKYRLLAENATDIVWTLDLKTLKLTYVSPSVEKIRGYSPAEAIELSLDKNLAPDSYALAVTEMEEELRRDREAGVDPDRVRMLQFREFCKDGSIVDTEATIRFLRDVNGFPTGLLGITRDITERRRAEEEQERLRKQLLQAQKMEAIGTLTGGIAHDFNNLLTIINGYTELILLDKTEDDPLYADLKTILETGLKGAEMVKRLLALSKKAPISPQHLDLNRIVDDSVKLMERTFPKMIEIETILGKDPGMVNADPVQVQQVVMNLCINAKEAMPAGGRLRIETRNMTVDDDYCRANSDARPGLFVLIQVSDSGSGIDADTRARIFDPFFTTKGWDSRKGTGLGLSVARGIVEQHGGWMTCESELGVGTTFKIYLPALEAPPEYTKPVAEPAAVAGAERMLLVDDEEYVRDLGKRILERSGYTVVIAANGKEALEIYKREQSNIALVVLDLIMPQMSGEKCLEGLLKINPHVKVIISTGHSLDAKQLQHLGSLAKGFVNKPYEVKQLAQTVRKVLDAQ